MTLNDIPINVDDNDDSKSYIQTFNYLFMDDDDDDDDDDVTTTTTTTTTHASPLKNITQMQLH
jgi:hypothetical protein